MAAIGAVMAQLNEQGQEHVVQFASRQLSEAEKKWDTREKELLLLYGLVRHFVTT